MCGKVELVVTNCMWGIEVFASCYQETCEQPTLGDILFLACRYGRNVLVG
jgi:hypothetical protein